MLANRDRCVVLPQEYAEAVGTLISDSIETDQEFANSILQEFAASEENAHCADHLGDLHTVCSEKAKNILVKTYKADPANSTVRYIIPRKEGNDDDELVPLWCDVKACKILHLDLYALLQDQFPSMDMIKKECREKLLRMTVDENETKMMHTWIQARKSLLFNKDQTTDDYRFPKIMVMNTEDQIDIPIFVLMAAESDQIEPRLNLFAKIQKY